MSAQKRKREEEREKQSRKNIVVIIIGSPSIEGRKRNNKKKKKGMVGSYDDHHHSNSCNTTEQKKRKKKRKKKKQNENSYSHGSNSSSIAKMASVSSADQCTAARSVYEWVYPEFSSPAAAAVDHLTHHPVSKESILFELHSHSNCSDGYLDPSAVVERAYRNGVKVLALTDHDTMAGIPEALEAARALGIKIIPGVEISATFSPGASGKSELVHLLAYYGSCGPAKLDELKDCLAHIREGRYIRAKDMISKLSSLKMPLKWEHITKIAGKGVAPGRLHVARALVEAGHVENLKQAFNRYLYDGGPAGRELLADEAVQLIRRTGGVAALAHPWALKNPVAVIQTLKAAGLHAMEVYRPDGKMEGFSDLADAYELVKVGGSDYHGRVGQEEFDLGSVDLPILVLHKFLKVARPIWSNAMKDILQNISEAPSDANLEKIAMFWKIKIPKVVAEDTTSNHGRDFIDQCLSSWLTMEEMEAVEIEALRFKLSSMLISEESLEASNDE
ncbi:hypothetical protein ACLOJK_016220 [Asimina triloba]